jgi:hypothetical protein
MEAIMKWERPINVIKIRSFMVWQDIIEGFFMIVIALTWLTRKEVKLEWIKDCERASKS